MKTALYPGTFDPVTNGHVDVIDRACRMFDRLIVAVADSAPKGVLFAMAERLAMLREVAQSRPQVEVVSFGGLLVHEFDRRGVDIVVRGVRLFQDFEFEYMMALMNRRLNPRFDVVFLMPSEEYLSVSSTLIKDIHRHGGDVSGLVPTEVVRRLEALRGKGQGA
jgi:pantetheine-phosphate adenylyltransferase